MPKQWIHAAFWGEGRSIFRRCFLGKAGAIGRPHRSATFYFNGVPLLCHDILNDNKEQKLLNSRLKSELHRLLITSVMEADDCFPLCLIGPRVTHCVTSQGFRMTPARPPRFHTPATFFPVSGRCCRVNRRHYLYKGGGGKNIIIPIYDHNRSSERTRGAGDGGYIGMQRWG